MNPLAASVESVLCFHASGKVEKRSQAWLGLNYSWRWSERSCKSLHLHFSAPGCAALTSDGVSWGKKAHDYPCRVSIPHGLAG